ncbi:MAG: glycosyltransferase [Candidatus Aminicenantes bacterium]|nr:glycosyltransferase [Candidatus Aminicenantes bacterium]NIM82709.1 glycosyltransferase [Candidatus Aminicenantes bacterium]NIN22081.1 glycosyltransferase [Candidatus Aminicenantes bacterium]NIN45840.1 glycosyltransferase [Candidatus Aminicenantes bacterium]NIN88677.1 glycosyltransferase [Candidatus Aminicenantes bacterium]
MNIWIFNHYAITPDYPGGTRHFELGKNISERGHRVVIFASNFIHMSFSFVELERRVDYKRESFGNLEFIWLKTRAYTKNNWKRVLNMLDYSRGIKRISRELVKNNVLEKPDVIIGSTVHPFAALAASSLARRFDVPFIFEIRDLWPRSFIDMGVWGKSSFQARFFGAIEKKTVSRARKIITLSPRTRSYLKEHYNFPSENIYYIPNGVNIGKSDSSETVPGSTLEALEQMKKDGAFIVLYSGSLIATNKLETIIDAAGMLRENKGLKLVMIGKGQEEERYRELIRSKKLENISISPPVQKEQVPCLLRKADLLILQQGNVQWGSSNKLYDYMASGRPIISSVHARHNDIIAEIDGGISVPPENPGELYQAILRLHGMPEDERGQIGQRNVDFVKKYHDWKVLSERLLDLLEAVKK